MHDQRMAIFAAVTASVVALGGCSPGKDSDKAVASSGAVKATLKDGKFIVGVNGVPDFDANFPGTESQRKEAEKERDRLTALHWTGLLGTPGVKLKYQFKEFFDHEIPASLSIDSLEKYLDADDIDDDAPNKAALERKAASVQKGLVRSKSVLLLPIGTDVQVVKFDDVEDRVHAFIKILKGPKANKQYWVESVTLDPPDGYPNPLPYSPNDDAAEADAREDAQHK